MFIPVANIEWKVDEKYNLWGTFTCFYITATSLFLLDDIGHRISMIDDKNHNLILNINHARHTSVFTALY